MPYVAIGFKHTKDGRRRPEILSKPKAFFSEAACEKYKEENMGRDAEVVFVDTTKGPAYVRQVKGALVKIYGRGGTEDWEEATTNATHVRRGDIR